MKFIKDGQNVILSGNCGTGKTHIAIALGIKACLDGYKVLFTTVPLFITQLKELKSDLNNEYKVALKAYDDENKKLQTVLSSYRWQLPYTQ